MLMLLAAALFAWPVLAQNNEAGVRVIVIDAGHGGSAFPGAVYGGVKEKDRTTMIFHHIYVPYLLYPFIC